MTDMQRYGIYCTDWQFDVLPADDGLYVLASDAEAAITAAREQELTIGGRYVAAAFDAGQRDMLARLQSKCAQNKHHDCVCDLGEQA